MLMLIRPYSYSSNMIFWWSLEDSSPLPVTPDYGSPAVCYADGVFDSRFDRFITVREGSQDSIAINFTPAHFYNLFGDLLLLFLII